MEIPKHKTIHLIGIGGAGMSAIARILLERGYKVSGSEMKETFTTIKLKDEGATIFVKHNVSNLRKADIVVLSSAIPENNVEYAYARQEKIPIYKRAEILSFLMDAFPRRIAVAGTHGKTTTTSMITRMLEFQNLRPTYFVGGEMNDYGGNAGLGDSDYAVAESDESDGSFLLMNPNIAVVNNIEQEHMEYYKYLDTLLASFRTFMEKVIQQKGYVVVNQDDEQLAAIAATFPQEQIMSYSLVKLTPVMAQNIIYAPEGVQFDLILDGKDFGTVLLRVHGKHNVYNALATITLGLKEQFPLDLIRKALLNFSGTKRRFQFVGESQNIKIYDDYGHHPTEIKTTIDGAKKGFNQRLVCIFQPHRYTRTRDLMEVFSSAFDEADLTIITEVYSANEPKIEGISGRLLAGKMQARRGKEVLFIAKKSDIAHKIMPLLKSGDMVITIGAGDIHTVAKELLANLKNQEVAQ